MAARALSTPLVSVAQLAELIDATAPAASRPVLLDVRWSLTGPPGRDAYLAGHLPGAVFVDLDTALAAPPGTGGRHPLPERDAFAAAMRSAGVDAARPVVAYDDGAGTSAARAWWLLRYFGHPAVAVLDGGFAAWMADGRLLTTERPSPATGDFEARPGGMPVLDADAAARVAREGLLLDARAPERFRGDSEPVDAVAGHIAGARNRPTAENIDPGSGRFRSPSALADAFRDLGAAPEVEIGAYCGSGVTAAQVILALAVAGYEAALYPGSWSHWITDPRRPVATGACS